MSQDARLDEEKSTQHRARILGMTYVDTSKLTHKPLFKQWLTPEELGRFRVVPINSNQNNILFGVTNNTSQQTMKELRQRFGDQRLSFSLISDNGFREYMRLFNPPKEVIYHDIKLTETNSADLIGQVSATLMQVRADDMLAYLVQQAHKLAASDIHLENQKSDARIRFRIDGVLHSVAKIPPDRCRMLISAVASAANVSTAADDAQQGHIAQHVRMADGTEVDINLRVETVPAINGMDIVMRLFNLRQDMYKLDKLGLSTTEREVVEQIIKKPSGLVLAVGPTGSGKTTTLYSMLNSLNIDERKIITIEDPVEYQFEGITQITVTTQNSGQANFADKLRAVLRLDPDIVMVGEIRDADTAKTALQASLTGHLVLSTFHAASAAAALTRLLDIIDENPLFLSAIRLVMAQRLVRKLDDSSKQAYQPDEATLKIIQNIVNGLPPNIKKPDISNLKLFKAGSSADNPYGFSGQLALREQLTMNSQFMNLLQAKAGNLSAQQIEEEATKSGMTTMIQDGILKVIAGQTTLEEIYRVVG